MDKLLPVAITLTAGGLGGIAFYLFGVPAAFLTGSAVAVTVAVASGLPTSLPPALRLPGFAILGTMIGSTVTADTLTALLGIPFAVLGLVVAVSLATLASYVVLRRFARWDPVTALCGSIPGALQTTLIVAFEAGARMDRVVMAQALRLFILVALVPIVFGGGGSSGIGFGADAGGGPFAVALSVVIAVSSALVGKRLRVPSAHMLAPLFVAAVLSLTGIFSATVPAWLAAVAFVLLGASVGTRFASIKAGEVVPMLLQSLAAFVAAFAAAIAVAALVSALLGASLGAVFLAYAPGGLDAMIALSFLLNYDVAFVAVLQVLRLFILSVCGPFLVTRVRRHHRLSGREELS